jgi:hypothetical protein
MDHRECASEKLLTAGITLTDVDELKDFEIQKERRVSLEVLVVPFERPCWPQKCLCAS